MEAMMFPDKIEPDAFRVEFIDPDDSDGRCEVAVFYGPRSQERARRFAEAFYGTFKETA